MCNVMQPNYRNKTDNYYGVWSWKRMPFGLRNAPATFVKAIRKVLYPIREHSDAYIDDTYTISHSLSITWSISVHFLLLSKTQDLLSLEKCKFAQTTTKFVGYLVGNGQIRPDPAKIEAVMRLKLPETHTQLRSTLGVMNYYRSHVPGYAMIAKPLTDILSCKKAKDIFI